MSTIAFSSFIRVLYNNYKNKIVKFGPIINRCVQNKKEKFSLQTDNFFLVFVDTDMLPTRSNPGNFAQTFWIKQTKRKRFLLLKRRSPETQLVLKKLNFSMLVL